MNQNCLNTCWFVVLYLMSAIAPCTDSCAGKYIIISQPKNDENSMAVLSSAPSPHRNEHEIGRRRGEKSKKAKSTSTKRTMTEVEAGADLFKFMTSFKCSPKFDLDYCLNGGRCFNYKIANYTRPSCECADEFWGERCEFKTYNGDFYRPQKISLAICWGAIIAIVAASCCTAACAVRFRYRKWIKSSVK